MRQNPGRPITVVPAFGVLTQDELIGGRPHHERPDVSQEVVVRLAERVEAELQQPVELVVFVGDETINCGGDVVLGQRHSRHATPLLPHRQVCSTNLRSDYGGPFTCYSSAKNSYPHSALFSRIVLLLCENWCYGKHRRPVLDHRPRGGRVRRLRHRLRGPHRRELVELEKTTSAHQRHLDAIKTAAAGELARRSRRELGHAGLAAREGFRSPEAMLQSITGATGARPTNWSPWVASPGRPKPRNQLLDDGIDDIGGEAVTLPWETPITIALTTGVLSAEQADALRRGLGTPSDQVSADRLRRDRRATDRRPRPPAGGPAIQGGPGHPGSDRRGGHPGPGGGTVRIAQSEVAEAGQRDGARLLGPGPRGRQLADHHHRPAHRTAPRRTADGGPGRDRTGPARSPRTRAATSRSPPTDCCNCCAPGSTPTRPKCSGRSCPRSRSWSPKPPDLARPVPASG